jgi:hypothetical protein
VLSQADREYLIERLTAALSALDARQALGSVLPTECLTRIAYHQFPAAYAMEAVRVCIEARWNHEPPWLLRLLQLLPPEPQTDLIRVRIATPPAMANPSLARILATDSPFVNREVLRTKLGSLRQPLPARAVLVVNGPRQSGKTYTAEYINHLVVNGLGFESCYVEFPVGNGLACGPEQLASDILVSMGVPLQALAPTFLMNTTNNERWPQDLAGRVLAEGIHKGNGKSYWVVLDGFMGSELREDTRKFVTALADHIVKSSVLRKAYRLVLLGFEGSFLTVHPRQIDLEEIELPGDTDILDCMMEIFARANQPITPPDAQVFLSRITSDLPGDDTRLSELNKRLIDLMHTLEGADA